ncbi:hypothetical protein F4808DRAFT_438931 [Astrocystis sublimbata]|nr:hypothetical protein F4808DRAFT_438931 [Astrocystis sublimbata]
MMQSTGVLMLGSVPGVSSREVFTRLATALPGRLQAIPDGETGERWNWIGWQRDSFPPVVRRSWQQDKPLPELGQLPMLTLEDIKPTRYDEVAISSYSTFKQLRHEGIIPSNVRFQVGLPTPYSVMTGHLIPEISRTYESLYEKRLEESLDRITTEISHDDLIIQWDLCFEMTAIEYERGRFDDIRHKAYFSESKNDVIQGFRDRLVRLSDRIPQDVKLGFHLCYGDYNHQHFVEPQDTTLLVEFANALLACETLGRRASWLHIPVPKSRVDSAYLGALAALKLTNGSRSEPTRLYLGLVHAGDETGTKERIKIAKACVPIPFGVATECGLGRTPPEEIDSILQICREVTSEGG